MLVRRAIEEAVLAGGAGDLKAPVDVEFSHHGAPVELRDCANSHGPKHWRRRPAVPGSRTQARATADQGLGRGVRLDYPTASRIGAAMISAAPAIPAVKAVLRCFMPGIRRMTAAFARSPTPAHSVVATVLWMAWTATE